MTRSAAPSLLLALAALAGTSAAAQEGSAFTTEEAARCGVVFARMAEALAATEDAPDVLVGQVAVGLPVWEYELIASAPGDEARLNAAVAAAIEELLANMPEDGADAAARRGDYLLAQAQGCGRMIDQAYPDARHPIVAQIRQDARARADGAGAVPVPSPKPDKDAEPEPRRRGLR